jgi:multiple sugar transport system substrate-binding protein
VTRRSVLKIGLMAAAAAPLVSACGTVQDIWPGIGRQAPGAASSDRMLRVVTLRPAELKFLGIIDPVDHLQKSIIEEYGETLPAMKRRAYLDDQWWAVGHFSRAGGYRAHAQPFADAGFDIKADLGSLDAIREAALKASRPDQELWGWGLTANRSGDGETTVRNAVMFSGGQLTDETGQVVVLNQEPYR